MFNFKDSSNIRVTDKEFIEREIRLFKASKKRSDMLSGYNYYLGKQDILSRKRTVIGASGELVTVDNLPNNRIVDNQFKKLVDQKNNYLVGQPITYRCLNTEYSKNIKAFFGKRFCRTMKNIGEDSILAGIGWLLVCYGENGELEFKRLDPSEVITGWADAAHTKLDYVIRVYQVVEVLKNKEIVSEKVEVYDKDGVSYFDLSSSGVLTSCDPYHKDYFAVGEQGYNWDKIPIVPFKFNSKEIPLICNVKCLQDGLNRVVSDFQNNMEEDCRNTILVLKNYDGENLGEFRKNLATYGAVKLRTVDGSGGDLTTLKIEVNAENYKSILEIFKKAIIENAMGYDAKDDRLSGNANQLNIMSMYSDIDLDANNTETEFQASLEELLWFVNIHLFNNGSGDFETEEIEFIFNRDMLMNEAEAIDNCIKSVGLLSNTSIIAQHPWVDDVDAEVKLVNEQRGTELNPYGDNLPQV